MLERRASLLGTVLLGVPTGPGQVIIVPPCAFGQVIRDYTTPANEELSRDLVNRLKPYIR